MPSQLQCHSACTSCQSYRFDSSCTIKLWHEEARGARSTASCPLQAFCSYISIGNYSDQPVSMVVIKAELATERQKISLYDNTQQPLRVLGPGQRHDFILKHDVKVGKSSRAILKMQQLNHPQRVRIMSLHTHDRFKSFQRDLESTDKSTQTSRKEATIILALCS